MIKSKASVLGVNGILFTDSRTLKCFIETGAGDLLSVQEKPPLWHFNSLMATHYGVPSRAFQLRTEPTGYPDLNKGQGSQLIRLIASML